MLKEFTCQDICQSCIFDRFGCTNVNGLTPGWDDKGHGIIVGCYMYENVNNFDVEAICKEMKKNNRFLG